MANAGLSSTLSHNSWSKIDWYGFFACFNFAIIVLLIQLSAFHILWQTRFYERITLSRNLRFFVVPPSQALAFLMLVSHACIATGLFFLIYNFQHETGVVGGVQVHHPGNFSWVVGWLAGSIFASWFVPLLIHASCNLWWPTIFDLGSLLGIVMAFAYEINYIRQTNSPQLSMSSPAMWLLIYPVVFKFYMLLVMIRAAVVSVTDTEYMAMCEAERGMVSDALVRYNTAMAPPASKGDFSVVVAKRALDKDDGTSPTGGSEVFPAPASVGGPPGGVSGRHSRSSVQTYEAAGGTSVMPPVPKTHGGTYVRQMPRQ